MVSANKNLFDEFGEVHKKYEHNDSLQVEYNEVGKKVLEAIAEWESKLCSQSEKGGYSSFTPKLAEKFREEIRKHYPLIGRVGIIPEPAFSIKKIAL